MKQTTFASMSFDAKKRRTRRERFLAEMEQVVPWAELVALIEPHYPKAGRRGRPPMPLESMRRFADLELIDDALPDETTILKFRRLLLLERFGLSAQMMNLIHDVLAERGALLKGGTMVDATIIHAPASTKNKARRRDPQMHQTKKGNQWYFGMKIHVGADVNSGLVHTVSVTPANASDVSQLPCLLREDDRAVFGDKAYV